MATVAAAGGSDGKIDIGRVFQNTFSGVGRHALPFAGLALLLGGTPMLAFYLVLDRLPPNADFFLSPVFWSLVGLMFVGGYLLQAVVVHAALGDAAGRPVDIGKSLVESLRLLPAIVGIAILSWLLIGLGALLLIVPGVILFLMLAVAVPAQVEERRGVFGSMARSRELTRGSRWRILGTILLFFIFFWIAEAAVGMILMTAGEAGVVAIVVNALMTTVSGLIMAALLTALYVELRTVKEGATADSLAAIFG